ncbi:MAG: esterase, partial [Deltaproteobacteria bacterium]|nr:esterase [Deltaproteobacteria bacterium]
QDLPLVLDHLQKVNPSAPLHVIAHSWGGVLLNSFLARFPHRVEQVQSMIYFGSKRNINTFSLKKAWVIDFLWDFIGGILSKKKGYLPAKALRFGSDDEPLRYYLDVVKWAKPKSPWVDTHDGFDYAQAIQKIELPSTLYLAGASDVYLGNPRDVIDFMKESGEKNACYRLLSKAKGNLHNYGHIDMLTHPDAVKDHFPLVLEWLHQHSKK